MATGQGMTSGRGPSGRTVLAATIGNVLEFYDFITYAYFSIQIGHAFFPTGNPYSSLMLSLATFGAGFITRPIGGIVIGAYADRVGRRAAMMLSFSMMGAAIIGLALIPSYAAIGVAAPILAVLARLVQGFSLGGEVGPNTAYLLEAAPPERRGYLVSWQAGSQNVAGLFAGIVGFVLASTLAPAALDAYGWRVAFLIGAITLPFGLLLRRSMPETLHEPEPGAVAMAAAQRGLAIIAENWRIISLSVVMLAAGTVATYCLMYMTTFAQNTLHMSPQVAFLVGVDNNAFAIAAPLFGGWLSDKIGRRPVIILPTLMTVLTVYPTFSWIVNSHSVSALLIGVAIITITTNTGVGAFYTCLTETLPKQIRGRTIATVYAVSIAMFGGTAQPMIAWLLHTTGDAVAPAWYMLAFASAAAIAALLMHESAPVRAPAEVALVH
jgi:MFS family permease